MSKKIISSSELLIQANGVLLNFPDFIEGMEVINAQQEGDKIIFRGEFFLNGLGMPTEKTQTSFEAYEYLSRFFSDNYCLH